MMRVGTMRDYPSPCGNCEKERCDYRKCGDYHMWLNTMWKRFRGYLQRSYGKGKTMKRQKFIYEHPDMVRQYLRNGPCGQCMAAKCCEIPCAAYLSWWDARMAVFRHKLGGSHD